MKEVTAYMSNWVDIMGYEWKYWFMPYAPKGDHPNIDGINWHMKALL